MSGPALPHESRSERHPWMSLRDYFAGQALPLAIGLGSALSRQGLGLDDSAEFTAKAAYQLADAMMKAREK